MSCLPTVGLGALRAPVWWVIPHAVTALLPTETLSPCAPVLETGVALRHASPPLASLEPRGASPLCTLALTLARGEQTPVRCTGRSSLSPHWGSRPVRSRGG